MTATQTPGRGSPPGDVNPAGRSQQPRPGPPDLIRRAQTGDPDAFATIYEQHVRQVRGYLYNRLGNRELAEDLTSETFLRAFRNIGAFTWQDKQILAWLYTIARNLTVDHYKAARHRYEVLTGELPTDQPATGPDGDPEAALVDTLTEGWTRTAVTVLLDGDQRECITLRYLDQRSLAETAAAMGRSISAIKALQGRGLATIARNLPRRFSADDATDPRIPHVSRASYPHRQVKAMLNTDPAPVQPHQPEPAPGRPAPLAEFGAWWCPCGYIGPRDYHPDCDTGPLVAVTVAILPREAA